MSTLVCCELTGGRSRDGLKLALNRSLSEPGPPDIVVTPSSPTSPVSTMPSSSSSSFTKNYQYRLLRTEQGGPMKRCKLESASLPTSPCTESSTLQHQLIINKVSCIDVEELKRRLDHKIYMGHGSNSNFLLVDCRSFIAYNMNHIRGAINVNCTDRFNRRRLQLGKAVLADLATSREGKELLRRRTNKEVIVYDDTTSSMDRITNTHPLYIVLSSLVEDNREPILLLGELIYSIFLQKY